MAQPTAEKSQLENTTETPAIKLLTCSVCDREYGEDFESDSVAIKLRQCGHTYCRRCVQSRMEIFVDSKGNEYMMTDCKQCRKRVRLEDYKNLAINYQVMLDQQRLRAERTAKSSSSKTTADVPVLNCTVCKARFTEVSTQLSGLIDLPCEHSVCRVCFDGGVRSHNINYPPECFKCVVCDELKMVPWYRSMPIAKAAIKNAKSVHKPVATLQDWTIKDKYYEQMEVLRKAQKLVVQKDSYVAQLREEIAETKEKLARKASSDRDLAEEEQDSEPKVKRIAEERPLVAVDKVKITLDMDPVAKCAAIARQLELSGGVPDLQLFLTELTESVNEFLSDPEDGLKVVCHEQRASALNHVTTTAQLLMEGVEKWKRLCRAHINASHYDLRLNNQDVFKNAKKVMLNTLIPTLKELVDAYSDQAQCDNKPKDLLSDCCLEMLQAVKDLLLDRALGAKPPSEHALFFAPESRLGLITDMNIKPDKLKLSDVTFMFDNLIGCKTQEWAIYPSAFVISAQANNARDSENFVDQLRAANEAAVKEDAEYDA